MNLSLQVAPSDISYGRCVRSYRVLLFPCCSPAPVLQPTVTRYDISVSAIFAACPVFDTFVLPNKASIRVWIGLTQYEILMFPQL